MVRLESLSVFKRYLYVFFNSDLDSSWIIKKFCFQYSSGDLITVFYEKLPKTIKKNWILNLCFLSFYEIGIIDLKTWLAFGIFFYINLLNKHKKNLNLLNKI
ncbi:hypothetical protein BpHYR1_013290 [Brachionus plicatilis]|uniref:Uncharacterized protein n=1 Tax=Brachionus plicatilis TaxID=10195 RepID=A0A3M7RVS4_BRAPC|nr:hypothetical protein BpHYR1_013290 [Brachionus plicatilis]